MPLTHNRSFRIRQYECNANGHLNNASYLRYMQETAFDASAAAGYDIAAYEKLNSIWLIRETGIEYFHPVTYGDNIVVKTWVEDFRKVSSRRVYEFHNPQSEQLVARAHTDWAYIDVQSNRPAKIPPQMTSSFYPEGLPEIFPQRKPFPPPPPPPDDVFSMNLTVKWHDIDVMEHVNNATYIDYMNACTMQMMSAYGYSWKKMRNEGIGLYARRIRVKYLQPALLDDELVISTWAFNMKHSTGERYYHIRRANGGDSIAQIITLAVWVDLNTGNPMRIPSRLTDRFASNIVK